MLTRHTVVVFSGVLLFGMAISGCARTVAPTGGDVPDTALRVVETRPAPFSQVDPFDGPVVFTFPRTLSERLTRGSLGDAVEVSPQDGDVTVRRRGNRIEVRMEGGFRRSEIYRVSLLPRLQDRFRNAQEERVDLYFSTGPAFEPTVLAGVVVDRLTGQEVRDARVEVTLGTFPEEASSPRPGPGAPAVHAVPTDSAGVFLFRFLSPGAYEVRAYDDINRNRRPDFAERQGATRLALGAADTVVVADLAILQPDTTPARLMEVALLDSLHLSLRFDDPIDPEDDLDGVRVFLEGTTPEGDEVRLEGMQVLQLHAHQTKLAMARWEEARDAARAADEVFEEEPPLTPDLSMLLPERVLVVVLTEPLPFGTTFQVRVEGLRNLSGVPGGGGDAEFTTPPAPQTEADPDPPDPRLDPRPGSGLQLEELPPFSGMRGLS